MPVASEVWDRFWNLVDKTDTCWNWTGATDSKGYGRFNSGDGTVISHIFSYRGEHDLADGMQLDHTCRNTSCVNPAHLEPVTLQENVRREFEAMAKAMDDKGFGSHDPYEDLWEYESRKLDQASVEYNPVGGNGEQACANCQFFIGPDKCAVVVDWPQPITPNGWSNVWRARVIPEDLVKARAEALVSQHRGKGFARFLQNISAKLLGGISEDPAPVQAPNAQALDNDWFFSKDKSGNLWWMAVATNNSRDNDYPPEIFTAKAHRKLMDRFASGEVPLPELWYWHTPGTRWGEAKMAGFDDGLVWYAGTIDPGMEGVARKVAALAPYLRVSHGYRNFSYDDKARGIIGEYETFEVSPLPAGREANPITAFAVSDKEMDMQISSEKRDHLEGIFGKEWVQNFEKRATALQTQNAGREQKEQTPTPETNTTPPPTPEPVPAGAPPLDTKELVASVVKGMTESDGFKALTSQVGDLTEAVKGIEPLAQRVTALEKALAEDTDARVDQAIAAKVMAVPAGVAPSERKDNLLTDDQATAYGAPHLGFDPAFLKSAGLPTGQ